MGEQKGVARVLHTLILRLSSGLLSREPWQIWSINARSRSYGEFLHQKLLRLFLHKIKKLLT